MLIGSSLALALLIGWNSMSLPSSALAWTKAWSAQNGPRLIHAPARAAAGLPWDDGARSRGASVTLKWDQLGTGTSGVGLFPNIGVTAAQALMHFGGGSATTGLLPEIRPLAASWSIFTCTTSSPCPPRVPKNGVMDLQRVNLWSAVFDTAQNRQEPGAMIFQTVFRSPGNPPGSATNTVNQFVSKTFTDAPQFMPSQHLFVGIGASGPNTTNLFWGFVAEPADPDAHREWFGSGATNAVIKGPTTISTQYYPLDIGIRLIVDPGVPPELDISTGPSASGASRLRTFIGP
jgi:hypothetical protein